MERGGKRGESEGGIRNRSRGGGEDWREGERGEGRDIGEVEARDIVKRKDSLSYFSERKFIAIYFDKVERRTIMIILLGSLINKETCGKLFEISNTGNKSIISTQFNNCMYGIDKLRYL